MLITLFLAYRASVASNASCFAKEHEVSEKKYL